MEKFPLPLSLIHQWLSKNRFKETLAEHGEPTFIDTLVIKLNSTDLGKNYHFTGVSIPVFYSKVRDTATMPAKSEKSLIID